jgi:DNA-binding NtrC family response regulator
MAGTSQSPIKQLIVDDDDDLREDLAQLFRGLGHNVTAVASGEDALAKAAHTRFDVALLDLHLPGISGIDVLLQLKECQPELEALMLTAHSSIETAVEAMKRGAYDYLTKPFRGAELEVHIQKAFEKVQLQRREQQWLRQLSYESPRYQLVGSSAAMRKVLGLIEKVAATDATVLVCGPNGTSFRRAWLSMSCRIAGKEAILVRSNSTVHS